MEEIVGPVLFSEAKEKLNRRLTNRDKLLTGDPARIEPHKDSMIERIVATEIENAMGECFEQV